MSAAVSFVCRQPHSTTIIPQLDEIDDARAGGVRDFDAKDLEPDWPLNCAVQALTRAVIDALAKSPAKVPGGWKSSRRMDWPASDE